MRTERLECRNRMAIRGRDWLQHPSSFNFSFSHQRDPTKSKRKGINAFPTDKRSLTAPRIRFLLSDGSFIREFSSTRGYIVAKCLATSMVTVLRSNSLVKMNNLAKYKLCSNLRSMSRSDDCLLLVLSDIDAIHRPNIAFQL